MYHFTFIASPTEDAQEFETAGGAYVDCWIEDGNRERAEERALDLIEDYGWAAESLEAEAVVSSLDYINDAENREFFEQALVEGEVLVFHTWPPDQNGESE
jgi:hypothetical protein